MQTIQLRIRDDISDKFLSFISQLPKNSVKIEYPELSSEQIKTKLKKAESDVKKNRVHSIESVKDILISRLK